MYTWQKCPSVWTGGKPFFYVAFPPSGKWTVIWNRKALAWEVISPYASMGTGFATSGKAMRFAEYCESFLHGKRED